MERLFATPRPVDLTVEVGAGTVAIHARDVTQTAVAVRGPRAEEFVIEQRRDGITVVGPRHRAGFVGRDDDHEVEVTVPLDSDLHVSTGSANVVAEGDYATARLKTGSGGVELGPVRGNLVVATGSGEVRCAGVGGDVRIKSGSGDVEVGAIGGTGAISTGSGDVVVGRGETTTVVKTGSGDAAVQHSRGRLVLTTGSGSLRIGRAEHGSVHARSASGDVRVGVAPGLPVWTDVTSATGRIGSVLPPMGKPAEGQQHLELRVRTSTGDILLEQAEALS